MSFLRLTPSVSNLLLFLHSLSFAERVDMVCVLGMFFCLCALLRTEWQYRQLERRRQKLQRGYEGGAGL